MQHREIRTSVRIFRTDIRKVYEPQQFHEALSDYTGNMGGGKILFNWHLSNRQWVAASQVTVLLELLQ